MSRNFLNYIQPIPAAMVLGLICALLWSLPGRAAEFNGEFLDPRLPLPITAPGSSADRPPDVGLAIQPVPVKVLYVSENQPIQIVDAQGRLVEVIYLKRK